MNLDPNKIARARQSNEAVAALFDRLAADAPHPCDATEPRRYAVIQTHTRRPAYTVGRVVTLDLTDYVFPISDGKSWHVQFGNKRDAFTYARSLGPVLPDVHVKDYTRPEGFAFKVPPVPQN
jgi:hypothetical protein